MIDPSPTRLLEEIRNAEKARDDKLKTFRRQVEAYVGPGYSKNSGAASSEQEAYDPNNHAFQYIAWMLPQLAYHNPKWCVKSEKSGAVESIAVAYRHGLTRWARAERMAERLQMVAVDFLENYGVVMVTLEDHPSAVQVVGDRKGKPSRRPTLERIPQDRYFRDPQASSEREIAFAGHSWISTRAELLERAEENPDEGWNKEMIESLSEGVGLESQFKSRRDNYWDIDRKQLALYEVWVRDCEEIEGEEDFDHPGPDEGFHGTIFTLAVDQAEGSDPVPRSIRKPRPFYGRPEGPYIVADVYPVSNEPYRLAPLIAVDAQVNEYNRLSRSINESAARYKRLILVSSAHDDLADIIADGEHDLVIPVPGLDTNEVVQLEVGGITQEMLATEARAKDIVERGSGFSEAAQGQVSGRSTATEAALVDQNSNVRTDFLFLRWHQFVAAIGEAVARYFWYDSEIQFSLGPESNEDLGLAPGDEAYFIGGDHDPSSGRTFEDLEINIEAFSTRRISEQQQVANAQSVLQGVQAIGQLAASMPWVDIKRVAEMYGEALNIPEFADLIDADLAAQMGTQMAMQQAPFAKAPRLALPGPSGSVMPPAMAGQKPPQTAPQSAQGLGMGDSAGQKARQYAQGAIA